MSETKGSSDWLVSTGTGVVFLILGLVLQKTATTIFILGTAASVCFVIGIIRSKWIRNQKDTGSRVTRGIVASIATVAVIMFCALMLLRSAEKNEMEASIGQYSLHTHGPVIAVDTAKLSGWEDSYHVMVIVLGMDSSIDNTEKTKILKSARFDIDGQVKDIAVPWSASIETDDRAPISIVGMYVLLVPDDMRDQSIMNVKSVLKHGGKLVGFRGIGGKLKIKSANN
jgi:hypothetical protein